MHAPSAWQHSSSAAEPGAFDVSALDPTQIDTPEAQAAIEADIKQRAAAAAQRHAAPAESAWQSVGSSGVRAGPARSSQSWAQSVGSPAKGKGLARTKAAGSAASLRGASSSRARSVASDAPSKEDDEDLEATRAEVDALLRDSTAIQHLVELPGAVRPSGAASGAEPTRFQVAGLHNPGYLCFMNASVQALFGCSAFSAQLRQLRGSSKLLGRARVPTLSAFAAFVESTKEVQGSGIVGSEPVRARIALL